MNAFLAADVPIHDESRSYSPHSNFGYPRGVYGTHLPLGTLHQDLIGANEGAPIGLARG
jgi:hypothetical protein